MISKREIIFLSAVVVAAGVLLYDQIAPTLAQNEDSAQQRVEEATAFVQTKQQQMAIAALKEHEILMLQILKQECPPNPFGRKWIGMIADQKNINRLSSIEPVLSYNGYMRTQDRIVAIVNGEDYVEGNKIAHVPLTIRNITPTQIDVENPLTQAKSRLSVKILPLELEDDED